MNAVKQLQENPELGAYRIHTALLQPASELIYRAFSAVGEMRTITKAGYVRFRVYLLYGERNLTGKRAPVNLFQDVLTLEYQEQPLARYSIEWQPDEKHLRRAGNARLYDHPYQSAQLPFPSGTTIMQVYDQADQELLILGEPGSGKSTLLLHLAQHLVIQAERDQACLLPVILPLSSWAVEQLPLTDWMSKQMAQTYGVKPEVSRKWVQQEQILPLLDGLDEVKETARPACIAAINTYHWAHFTPLVVCSRLTEYEALARRQRLILQSAVVVRPLTQVQIDAMLRRAGEPVEALRTALQEQPVLQELAASPLMLNVLMLTYQGRTMEAREKARPKLQRRLPLPPPRSSAISKHDERGDMSCPNRSLVALASRKRPCRLVCSNS